MHHAGNCHRKEGGIIQIPGQIKCTKNHTLLLNIGNEVKTGIGLADSKTFHHISSNLSKIQKMFFFSKAVQSQAVLFRSKRGFHGYRAWTEFNFLGCGVENSNEVK